MIIIAIAYLIPFYIIARNALMTKQEIAQFDWLFWASESQWQNFTILMKDPIANMGIGLKNSALVSFLQVIGRLLITALAGYGLARIKYKWADYVFYFVLVALMVPSAAIFVQTLLEEAAKVDGLGTFWRIVVPNSKGVFIFLGTLGLIRSWNSFLWPLIIGQSRETWTVQVVLSTFLTAQTINLPALFMGAAVGIIPVILIFFIVQRYIVEGVRVSGIK